MNMKIIFKLRGIMKKNEYNTRQKQFLLDIIKLQNKDFTIKDIYNQIDNKIGLTTIYRFIDKLVLEGRVTKTINNDNITYYRYLDKCDKTNHFYLKCDVCNNLIHVDCKCINTLFNHIKNNHGFELNTKNIIITGVCSSCKDKHE